MKYKVCLLLTIALVCSTMAYADIRNSRRSFDAGVQSAQNMGRRSTVSNWTNKSSALPNFGSTWNYKGTELNGISHGSGHQDQWKNRNAKQRKQGENQMTENVIDYTMSNVEVNYTFDYSYSFGDIATEAQAYNVVSSEPWSNEYNKVSWGGIGYGSSQVQEYRYASGSSNNTIIEDMIEFVEMRIPTFGEESLAESLEMSDDITERMFGAGRNGDPGATPGEGKAPLGDGMIPLALLVTLLAVLKWKKD